MILMYCDKSDRGPMLMCGILPEEIAMAKSGQRLFVSLEAYSKFMPPWTLSINCGALNPNDKAKQHISVQFQCERALDRFVNQRSSDFPKEMLGSPFNLFLFYTESVEKWVEEVMATGVTIEHFEDHRPGGMVN